MGVVYGVPSDVADSSIVECLVGDRDKEWKFVRTRTDKDAPNVTWVANRIMEAVRDNITLEDVRGIVKAAVDSN